MEDYYSNISGSDIAIDSTVEFARREQLPKDQYSTTERLGAVASQAFLESAGKTLLDRNSRDFIPDPEFSFDEESIKNINANFNEKESGYLLKSLSKEDYLARQKDIEDDRRVNSVLAEMGVVKSTSAILALSLFDPANWLSFGAAIKGFNTLNSTSRAVRALKTGAVAGLDNLAMETVFYNSNTQSTTDDLVFAAVGGGIFGASIGALSRGKNPNMARHVDNADAAIRADHEAYINKSVADQAEVAGVKTELDTILPDTSDKVRIQNDLRYLEANLKAQEELRLKPQEVDNILDELAFIESRRKEISKASSREPGVESALGEAELRKIDAETADLDARSRELESKLDQHELSLEAEKFRKKWKTWSSKKKIKRLYGNNIPDKKAAAERQKASTLKDSDIEEEIKVISKEDEPIDQDLLTQAKSDPLFSKKLDELSKAAEDVKIKAREEIESRYGCKVTL